MFAIIPIIIDNQEPLLLTWINFNPAWISNHMPGIVWDEINYPFQNFNGEAIELGNG